MKTNNRYNDKYCIEALPNRYFKDRVKQILLDNNNNKDIDQATRMIVKILKDVIDEQRQECKFHILNNNNNKKEKERWINKDSAFMYIDMLIDNNYSEKKLEELLK